MQPRLRTSAHSALSKTLVLHGVPLSAGCPNTISLVDPKVGGFSFLSLPPTVADLPDFFGPPIIGERLGRPDRHPYGLFLQLEDIEHRTTNVNRPQSNGIVERFHRTLLDEHFRVEGRRTRFETIDEMQLVLDKYLVAYNRKRPHQGRRMNGRTPWQAFQEGLPPTAKTNTTTEQKKRKPA